MPMQVSWVSWALLIIVKKCIGEPYSIISDKTIEMQLCIAIVCLNIRQSVLSSLEKMPGGILFRLRMTCGPLFILLPGN